MGYAAAELAYRIHALRGCELLLRLAQDALGLHPLGDVPRDLGKTNQVPRLCTDGVDHDRRPEPAAVLAHAPALCLELPVLRGSREHDGRNSRGAILFGVEAAEVPADDLLSCITLDAL